ncbi:MAG: hypothetical protein GF344_13390 [Chitinivibrionales bacterium]|nr:hypothetical protein [Chitinivibrionales bacterium]MBD3357724.1 hypothetical protein [Chitinivibrionales bacterium]
MNKTNRIIFFLIIVVTAQIAAPQPPAESDKSIMLDGTRTLLTINGSPAYSGENERGTRLFFVFDGDVPRYFASRDTRRNRLVIECMNATTVLATDSDFRNETVHSIRILSSQGFGGRRFRSRRQKRPPVIQIEISFSGSSSPECTFHHRNNYLCCVINTR